MKIAREGGNSTKPVIVINNCTAVSKKSEFESEMPVLTSTFLNDCLDRIIILATF